MTYEIRTLEKLAGKTYRKTFITSAYEKTTCKKGLCIKFKEDGKKTATYIYAERKAFHEDFEITIAEATTGRIIERTR